MNITPETTVDEMVAAWLDGLRARGHLEAKTIYEYARVLQRLVVPELGTVRLNELTTERINGVLADLGTQSVNRQRKAKVVTGAMLDVAVGSGALALNPVRGSISVRRPKSQTRTLTPPDLERVRAAVHAWVSKEQPGPKATGDMVDVIDLMLGTGARIGEVLALRWSDVNLEARSVEIGATIETETGMGTYRKPLVPPRIVELSGFAIAVLCRRRARWQGGRLDAVFTTRNRTWQQVNNVKRRWRQIRKEAGLNRVTPDAFLQNVAREA